MPLPQKLDPELKLLLMVGGGGGGGGGNVGVASAPATIRVMREKIFVECILKRLK